MTSLLESEHIPKVLLWNKWSADIRNIHYTPLTGHNRYDIISSLAYHSHTNPATRPNKRHYECEPIITVHLTYRSLKGTVASLSFERSENDFWTLSMIIRGGYEVKCYRSVEYDTLTDSGMRWSCRFFFLTCQRLSAEQFLNPSHFSQSESRIHKPLPLKIKNRAIIGGHNQCEHSILMRWATYSSEWKCFRAFINHRVIIEHGLKLRLPKETPSRKHTLA